VVKEVSKVKEVVGWMMDVQTGGWVWVKASTRARRRLRLLARLRASRHTVLYYSSLLRHSWRYRMCATPHMQSLRPQKFLDSDL
jgi:hypothetical protein